MECCPNTVCINCFVVPCTESIELNLVATTTEVLMMVYTFNHANIKTNIDAVTGENIVIPNNFNEDYSNPVRFYKADGTLYNNTCYILNTMPTTTDSADVEPIPPTIEYQIKEEKGQPNGYASLDDKGKVPLSQLPTINNTAILSFTTIYVDNGNPSSTDTRASLSKYDFTFPFRTIEAALATAIAGDTIYIKKGIGNYTFTATPVIPLKIIIDGGNVSFTNVTINMVASNNFISVLNNATLTITALTITDANCNITSDNTGTITGGAINVSATDTTKLFSVQDFKAVSGTYDMTGSAVSLFNQISLFKGTFLGIGNMTQILNVQWLYDAALIGLGTNLGTLSCKQCTITAPNNWFVATTTNALTVYFDDVTFNAKAIFTDCANGSQVKLYNSNLSLSRHIGNIYGTSKMVGNNEIVNCIIRDSQTFNGLLLNCAGNLLVNGLISNIDYIVPSANIQPTVSNIFNFVTAP